MIFNQKHPCALGDLEHSFSALHWFVRFRDSIRTSCLQMEYKYNLYSAPNIFRSFIASNQPPKGN